jgi:hypothetical protein
MPLFVSAYVYDFSGFYNFDWLKKMKIEDTKDKFNLNINAGFDETSFIIESILPNLNCKFMTSTTPNSILNQQLSEQEK